MRWNKKERETIEEQIWEYDKKIANPRCKRLCIFCRTQCSTCINRIIDYLLELPIRDAYCNVNKYYFIDKFSLDKTEQFIDFAQNMQQLKFRRQMWQDSLGLTKREFVKKYKKRK